jgi:RNA polymerase sigma-70 factor, ECF subfamily
MLTTSASLLGHLREADDPKAWERFVHTYSPVLYAWAGRMGLQHADSLDLVQEVFVTLVQKLPEYAYDSDRGFRNWLFVVTRNKCREKARRKSLHINPCIQPDELDSPVDEKLEKADFHRYVLERVLPGISDYFQVSTWQAFLAYVVDEQPAVQVAARLGISVNAVLKAKARVLSRLHAEFPDLSSFG